MILSVSFKMILGETDLRIAYVGARRLHVLICWRLGEKSGRESFVELKQNSKGFKVAYETGKVQGSVSLKIFGIYLIFKNARTAFNKIWFCRQNSIVDNCVAKFFIFIVTLHNRKHISFVNLAKNVISVLFHEFSKYQKFI